MFITPIYSHKDNKIQTSDRTVLFLVYNFSYLCAISYIEFASLGLNFDRYQYNYTNPLLLGVYII